MTVLAAARVVTGHEVHVPGWVEHENGRIVAVGAGRPAVVHRDLGAAVVVPGFVDIHCHGAGGASVDDGEQAIDTMLAVHNAHGTTRSVLSLVTAGVEPLADRLGTIARVAARDPRVLGAHLEGPFLDTEFRGAHDPALLRPADADSVERLLAAADGTALADQLDDQGWIEIAGERIEASEVEVRADRRSDVALAQEGTDWDAATGNRQDPSSCAAMFRRLARAELEVTALAHGLTFGPAGHLAARLGAGLWCDLTTASTTGLLDATTRDWHPVVARAAELDPALLPRLTRGHG